MGAEVRTKEGTDNMKSDAFDTTGAQYSYSNGHGLVTTQAKESKVSDYKVVEKIEVIVKALGTMILMPEYEQDASMIGTKYFKGNVQLPILMEDRRVQALDKLTELINSL